MSHSRKSPIRLAIIGGGLAGSAIANALVHLPHIDFHVYESAPEFSERGASVILSSTRALERIVPSAKELLRKAGAVAMGSSIVCIGSGPEAGTVVADMTAAPSPEGSNGYAVHRASLLRELLAPLPKEVLHANKKVTLLSQADDIVSVTFEDGTVSRFDAVIGADGIFGYVRSYVLQDLDHAEEYGPTPAGFWDSRVLVPIEKARRVIGEKYFSSDGPDCQHGWIGEGAFMLYDVVENGTLSQVVISAIEDDPLPDQNQRKRPLNREFLENVLGAWLDGPVGKSIIDLTLDQPDPQRYSEWEHKHTPTYVNARVCIAGDAAHAMTPWQAAGAGQVMEDAMILGTLLGNVKRAEEINAAFKAFDAVRRPRCQRIIDSSRGTGIICCGKADGVGLDPGKITEALGGRWDFIMGLDLDQYKVEALQKMEEFLKVKIEV